MSDCLLASLSRIWGELKNIAMKKQFWHYILWLLMPVLSQAQPPKQDFDKMAVESSKHWLDVDYVGDRHIGRRLDIHLPKIEQEKYPIVICIYGSAWFSNNSKSSVFANGLGQTLLENGFAVVSINHRSSRDAVFPAQIQDVKAAVRFIRANADNFSLDASFIGVTGWSSGGHLSALTGATNNTKTFEWNGKQIDIEGELGEYTQTSSLVNAVVDWFGPTDFLIMDKCGSSFSHDDVKSPESSLVGGAIQSHKDECKLADPATYVNKNTPPFLIFHGDADPLVPHCQSEHLQEKLEAAGAESTLHIIEGGKHGPGVMTPENYRVMIAFFKKKL